MSIDARARSAVRELREAAPVAVTTGSLLQEIANRHDIRRRQRRAGFAVIALVVVAIAAGFAAGRAAPGQAVPPAGGPGVRVSTPECGTGTVTCLGPRTYRVALPLPVTMTLPQSFGDNINDSATTVEVYNRPGHDDAGVTIFEAASSVAADGGAAFEAGIRARDVATWLSRRPFVQPTTPSPASVGGLAGYRVDMVLRPGASLPATKAGNPAALVFSSGAWSAAVSRDLRSSTYYLVNAPSGQLIVIWSWTWDGTAKDLTSHAAYIDTLQFG